MSQPATIQNAESEPPRWALVLAFTAVYLSWGTTYMAIRIGVHDEALPPALFCGTRSAIAGLLLLAYQLLRGQSIRIPRAEWRDLFLVSFLIFAGGNGLIHLAERSVESGVAAAIAATTPLCIGLFAVLLPGGDRLTLRGWLGLLVGLAGVVALVAFTSPEPFAPAAFVHNVGPFIVLGAACCWALGSLFLRHRRPNIPHLTLAGYQMTIGGLSLTLIGAALGETHHLPPAVTLQAVVVYIYLIIVGSWIGFIAFNWLLAHVSATKVGTHAYVNPMVAVLLAWLAGETMSPGILGCIITIFIGVFLVRGGERPARPKAEPAAASA